ncbi:serine hydrolase [Williamsia sp. 1135]|uniref:serine hydrolase n=1 Tax=Williamsia sp. 1135 TaxID=1889262 RepID=UPI000A0F7429|nr:serine hydrolase [Williamsia sp. 1135]ORM36317.1 hypothetical protein BFL43_07400 [Williamsia sp. 1135]
MFARSTSAAPPLRTVVAASLIAAQILVAASVGAVVCGSARAAAPVPTNSLLMAPSGPVSADHSFAALAAAQATATAGGGIDLDAAVLDTTTGVSASTTPAPVPMFAASLAKLVVTVDVIDRRRDDDLVVGEPDLELLRRALGPSDDLAMNELWERFDGQGAAARVSARVGLVGTTAPVDPSYWGQMTTTAADLATLYRHVISMPEMDRDMIIGALAAAPPVATDGFAQDFGLLAPRQVGIAVAKQGWMCCDDQTSYLHSAGLVGDDGRFVVVLLSRQQFDQDWQPERDRLTALAAAVYEVLDQASDVMN